MGQKGEKGGGREAREVEQLLNITSIVIYCSENPGSICRRVLSIAYRNKLFSLKKLPKQVQAKVFFETSSWGETQTGIRQVPDPGPPISGPPGRLGFSLLGYRDQNEMLMYPYTKE